MTISDVLQKDLERMTISEALRLEVCDICGHFIPGKPHIYHREDRANTQYAHVACWAKSEARRLCNGASG